MSEIGKNAKKANLKKHLKIYYKNAIHISKNLSNNKNKDIKKTTHVEKEAHSESKFSIW